MSESFKDKATRFVEDIKDKLQDDSDQGGMFGKIKNIFSSKSAEKTNLDEIEITELGIEPTGSDDQPQSSDHISEDDIGDDTAPFDLGTVSLNVEKETSSDKNVDIESDIEINATQLLQAHRNENDAENTEEDEEEEEELEIDSDGSFVDKVKFKYKGLSKITRVSFLGLIFYVFIEILFPDAPKPDPKVNNKIAKKAAKKSNREITKKPVKIKNKKEEQSKRQRLREEHAALAEKEKKAIGNAEEKITTKDVVSVGENKEPTKPKLEEVKIKVENVKKKAIVSEINKYGFDNTTEQNQKSKNTISKIIEQQKKLVKKEKIAKEEYQPMPDFDEWGRGFVYNCKGKHWACVNREGFFQCKKNETWNFVRKNKAECVTQNVYASFTDCRKVQLFNINQSVKKEFCDK